jgi:hypothetical protein
MLFLPHIFFILYLALYFYYVIRKAYEHAAIVASFFQHGATADEDDLFYT